MVDALRIPNIFHFVFLGFTDFTFIHYLSLLTCKIVHQPDTIFLYVHHIPIEGKGTQWWYLAQDIVSLERVPLPKQIFGQQVTKFQHMADIIRLEKLIERGGIYLDLDVVSIRPVSHLYNEPCVLGKQCPNTRYEGLCNAVIMAEPQSVFLKRWYNEYRSFRKTRWDHHSVKVPLLLSRLHGEHLRVMDSYAFFPVNWEEPEFMTNRKFDHKLKSSYLVHLWESEWEKTVLRNQGPQLLQRNSTFARYLNPILGLPNWDDILLGIKQRESQVRSKQIFKPLNPTHRGKRGESIFPQRKQISSASTKAKPVGPVAMNPRPGIPYVDAIPKQPITQNKKKKVRPSINIELSVTHKPQTSSQVAIDKLEPPLTNLSNIRRLKRQVDSLQMPYQFNSQTRSHTTLVAFLNHLYLDTVKPPVTTIFDTGKHSQVVKTQAIHWLVNQYYSLSRYLFPYFVGISGKQEQVLVTDNQTLKDLTHQGLIRSDINLSGHQGLGKIHQVCILHNDQGTIPVKLILGQPDCKGDLSVPLHHQRKIITIPRKEVERRYRLSLTESHSCIHHSIQAFQIPKQMCTAGEIFGILKSNFPHTKFIWIASRDSQWEADYLVNTLANLSTLPHQLSLGYLQCDTPETRQLASLQIPNSVKLYPVQESQYPEVLICKKKYLSKRSLLPLRAIPNIALPILVPRQITSWITVTR